MAQLIRVFVDDHQYFTSHKDDGDWKSWQFTRNFLLALNFAVVGDWGGVNGVDQSAFSQRMKVANVRAYQRTDRRASAKKYRPLP